MPRNRWENGENVGPTWGNVQVTARYVSREHHCFVRCVLEPRLLKDDVYRMQVRAEAWKRQTGPRETRVAVVVRDWPNREHKTMPGCMYRMLMDLDKELEEIETAKQLQLPL